MIIFSKHLVKTHWRSSHYAVTHVRIKNSNIQCGKSDLSYHKELLLKEIIRFLWEQIIFFKRSSHFEKGRY